MERSTLKNCLLVLSSVKKNLVVTPLVEQAWYHSLINLSDSQAKEAFAALMRKTIYGDVEPAHVLETATELAAEKLNSNEGIPWIKTAPEFHGDIDLEFPSPEFKAFLGRERDKKYRALRDCEGDPTKQEVVLIANPAAWNWHFNADRRPVFHRPPEIRTGEIVPKKTKKAA